MLQRNDTPYRWTWTGDAPYAVQPGEITDHPALLDGWTAVEGESPTPEPEAEPAKATQKSKRTATAHTDGGEPQ